MSTEPGQPHFATTNAAALSADDAGAQAATDQPVYYIVIHGHFVAYSAPRPYGSPAPQGTVITLGIDASTGDETSFSVMTHDPNDAALGTPTSLN